VRRSRGPRTRSIRALKTRSILRPLVKSRLRLYSAWRSCLSHTERRFGVTLAVPVACVPPNFQKLRGFTRAVSLAVAPPGLFTPRRHRASIRPGPFAFACDALNWNSPPLHAGFIGSATPAGFRSSVIPPRLRPLSSTGVTPRPRYYGPLRHPAGPACPSRGPGCRVHGADRASRVATPSIFHACRRHYPGGNEPVPVSLSSRPVSGLPCSATIRMRSQRQTG